MAADAFIAQLNLQIGHEFAAHHQYVACAIYYDEQTMQQTAQLFFDQAVEERNHAMMMVRYLLDADARVEIPGDPRAGLPTSPTWWPRSPWPWSRRSG